MSPAYSCPKMNSPYGGICGMPWWMIFRSVPQMPQALTRTRTSSSPGAGTGRSSSSKRCGATRTVAFMVAGIAIGRSFRSHAQVVLLHQLVLAELARVPAFELDLPVHDDVPAIGDLRRLVEVLLGHQHRQLPLLLQLLDLGDHATDEDRGEADRRLVHEQDLRRGHQRATEREHLLLAAAHAAGELTPPRAQHRERVHAELEV